MPAKSGANKNLLLLHNFNIIHNDAQPQLCMCLVRFFNELFITVEFEIQLCDFQVGFAVMKMFHMNSQ